MAKHNRRSIRGMQYYFPSLKSITSSFVMMFKKANRWIDCQARKKKKYLP